MVAVFGCTFADMAFLYIKALHIIFIVTWFAGLFYAPRLFIYTMEVYEKEAEPARSILLEKLQRWTRLLWYGITWPSAIITLGMGLSLIFTSNYQYNMPDWLWIKIGFVTALYAYHLACHGMFKKLQRGEQIWSSQKLRFWNEVSTILLFAIVFLVILKNMVSVLWGLLGLVIFTVLLMLAITLYKKIRESKG
jgi:putative membrane protein